MFERLLVTTDGSPFATLALPIAADLARRYGAALTVLYVAPGPVALSESAAYAFDYETERERQRARGAQLLDEARTLIGLPDVRQVFREGVRIDQIIAEEVAQGDIGLVVMSSHGRSGLAHFFLGSVAEAVLRRVQVPVFLVRAPDPPTAPPDTPAQEART